MRKISLKKLLRILFIYFAVLFWALGLVYFVTLLPIKNNIKIFTVTSGSMGQAVPIGSLAFVRPQTNYSLGDIITFKENSYTDPITHRIAKVLKDEELYITKGDLNNNPDQSKIKNPQIFGKFLFCLPILGYPVAYANTLLGLIILVIIPATIIIYEEIHKIIFEISKKREQIS